MDIFLIEDNFVQREFIKKMITKITNPYEIAVKIRTFANVDNFLAKINLDELEQSSVFFLDIDLQSSINGIEFAVNIRNKLPDCLIYFVTSNPGKAAEIINRNILASGYLIKDLEHLDELEPQIKQIFEKLLSEKKLDSSYIEIKQSHTINLININDIVIIESLPDQKGYVQLHTKKNNFIFRSTINKLKEKIDAPFIAKDLKSYIINIHHIQTIERKLGIITFDKGIEIYASKRIIDKLIKKLKQEL
ncbi:response regulator transcription factor [Listeria aquatica]|uniref:Response regulator transcription factor n=1 Tax=Listeria aquatica TaxID=1494960 RepID=A0A841ZKR3_9LIST|nr:LytTR family DNA-binding domain-containing protein [Listeria aquatica]MBC1520087.1 response regulator transcription factor [Listeria aquatica]